MSLRAVLSAYGVLGIVFGLGYLLIPTTLFGLFGAMDSPSAALAARFAGSSMLGFGILSWLSRGGSPSEASMRALLSGLTVTSALSAILSVVAVLTGTFNAYGWIAAVGFGLLAALGARHRFGRA